MTDRASTFRLAASAALVAALQAGEPGFNEFPIEMTPDIRPQADGAWIVQINHRDRIDDKTKGKPTPSRVRAYVPPGKEPCTAVIFDLGYTYTCDQGTLQAIARAKRWVIVSCLLRYKRGTELYDAAMGEIAKATGHEEIPKLPIIPMGFSRNGSRAWEFLDENASRVAALGLGGNPGYCSGEPAKWTPERKALIEKTPAFTVVGSSDPFVDYDKGEARFWHVKQYPVIRSWNVPWGMMLLWKGGHGWGESWPMFIAYFDTVLAQRGPELKPVPHDAGWLVEGNWTKDWVGDWPKAAAFSQYDGDKAKTVWLPNGRFIDQWRGFAVKEPKLTLAVGGTPAEPVLTAEPPAGATAVEFRDLDQTVATAKAAPWSAPAPAIAKGLHHLCAVAVLADGSRTASRPVTVVDGVALDWKKAAADEKAAEGPANVIRLDPKLRQVLTDKLAGKAPAADQLDALKAALEAAKKSEHVEQREAAGKLLTGLN